MQFTHYYQNLIGDDFRLFDYKNKNLMRYNSKTPPEYQLSNVIAPLHLYHASQDLFITTKVSFSLANIYADQINLQFVLGC